MTVDDWLASLEAANVLPCSYHSSLYFTLKQWKEWGVFRDWLLDHEEDEMVALVDHVRESSLRPHHFQGVFFWYGLESGWCTEESSGVPLSLLNMEEICQPPDDFHEIARPTLLASWQTLFARVKERGFQPGEVPNVATASI